MFLEIVANWAGYLVDLANGLNQLSCLSGGFYAPCARVSKSIYSGPYNSSLLPYKCPIQKILFFIRFLLSLL